MSDGETLDLAELDFTDLAALAPKHDSTACTRAPCRRCAGPHDPNPPKPKHNPHQVGQQQRREPSPFDPLPAPLTRAAPTMPTRLAKLMLDLAEAITVHGEQRWATLLGWEKYGLGISLIREEPDEDSDEHGQPRRKVLPSQTEEDRNEDHRAGRYADEARTTTLHALTALEDNPTESTIRPLVVRLRFLVAVAELRVPRTLKSRELLATQAATDGWCRSCFRVGVFEPIGCRPTGEPFYRDLCRWCGSNKGDAPQPTVDIVRVHHRIPERKTA